MKQILASLLFGYLCHSQTSTEIVNNIPMTPESYQFKKRFVTDVSMYTGQPDISIPIYTINMDGMQIPIYISCSTGGIKVDEESSIIGLGWMLNTGGEISRNNHGAPDEKAFTTTPYNSNANGVGYLKNEIVKHYPAALTNPYPYNTPEHIDWNNRESFYNDAVNHSDPYKGFQYIKDSRPDEFYYSLFGHSGKFMYNQEFNKFVTFPIDDISIDYLIEYLQGSGNQFKNFTTIFPNGFKITLGEDGKRSVRKISGPLFDQAWQIKKISSPNNNEIIYNYISTTYSSCTNGQWSENHYENVRSSSSPAPSVPQYPGNLINSDSGNCYDYSNYEGLISSINFPEGRIEFTYSNRIDLSGGSKKLDEIKVFDRNNLLIKRVKFNHSYFVSNFLHDLIVNSTTVIPDIRGKRLRLDSVEIFGNSSDDIPQKYSFDYYTFDKIPSKNSFATDYWGYFTGRSGQSLIPPKYNPNCSSCNKDVDLTYSQIFSIKKIQYPEGGIKIFKYENHKADIRFGGFAVEGLFNEISDELYQTLWFGTGVSGWALNNYTPTPVLEKYTYYTRTIYGEPFEIKLNDDFFSITNFNENNFFISSDLPSKVPLALFGNSVQFFIQKFNGTSFDDRNWQGGTTISNTENKQGIASTMSLSAGIYRFCIKVNQSYVNANDVVTLDIPYTVPHHSYISMKLRRKTKTEFTIGGLRIKEIETYPNTNLTGDKYLTKYSYLNDEGISSGVVTSMPSFTENIAGKYAFYYEATESTPRSYTGYRIKSQSTLPMIKTSGSNVGYTKVTKEEIGGTDKTKTEYYFTFQSPFFSDMWQNDARREFEPKDWQRGKLKKTLTYKNTDVIKEEVNEYYGEDLEYDKGYVEEINSDLLDMTENNYSQLGTVSKYVFQQSNAWTSKYGVDNITTPSTNNTQKIPYFKIFSGFDKLKSTTTKSYFNGNIVTETKEFDYPNLPEDLNLKSLTTKSSANETIETKYYYSKDIPNEQSTNDMIAKNMISIPIKTENFKGQQKISEQKTEYIKDNSTNNLVLPKYVYSKKGSGQVDINTDKKITYDLYDEKGNILQYKKENSIPTSIIWGYNNTQPIAKIENAIYADISSYVVNLQIKSNADNDRTIEYTGKEGALREALNSLRSLLPNAMVTTYTYDPLIGVTSITDPRGYTTYYSYDSFGRLENVKDADGNILSENKYHYKN